MDLPAGHPTRVAVPATGTGTGAATLGFDVFAGGCLTTRLVAPPEHHAQLTGEMSQVIGFTARQRLDQLLEQRSTGRLRLDPAGPS